MIINTLSLRSISILERKFLSKYLITGHLEEQSYVKKFRVWAAIEHFLEAGLEMKNSLALFSWFLFSLLKQCTQHSKN